MNKRKQRDLENHIDSVDVSLINSLKKRINNNSTNNSIDNKDNDYINQIKENEFYIDLLEQTLNINLFCDKKKPTKNCIDNPNCFHHLGQKSHSVDIDTYVIENLINDHIKQSNNSSNSNNNSNKPIHLDDENNNVNSNNDNKLVNSNNNNTDNSNSNSNNEVNNKNSNRDKKELIQHIEERNISNQPAGLKNLGATCYVNSLLQLLFMNREFRKLILEMNNQDNNESDSGKKNEILDQLRLLFLNMQFNRNKVFDPTEFVNTLQLSNSIHQDIQEFFILFIGLIETQIDLINQHQAQNNNNGDARNNTSDNSNNFLKQLFQGNCNYITECLKCHNKSKSPSSFFEIQLQVEGSNDLEESLKRYLSKEFIKGDYFCKKCNSKGDCSRSIELTIIPPYLNFQLLRYSFDKNTFRKKKIHDSFSFPLELDLFNFLNKLNQFNNSDVKGGKEEIALISDDDEVTDNKKVNQKKNKSSNNNSTNNNSSNNILESDSDTDNEMEVENKKNINQIKAIKDNIKNSFYGLKDTILEENEDEKLDYNDVSFYKTVQTVVSCVGNNSCLDDALVLFRKDLFLDKYKDLFLDIVRENLNKLNNSDNFGSKTTTTTTNNSTILNSNNRIQKNSSTFNNNNKLLTKSIKLIDNNLNKEIKKEELIYELSGILMHQGVGTSGGHYICHLKDDISGKWFKFDDESVEEIELKNLGKDGKNGRRKKLEGSISSSTAYMVFYSKKNRNSIHYKEDSNNLLKSYSNLSSRLLNRLEEMEDSFISNKSNFDLELEKMKLLWKDRIEFFNLIEPLLQVNSIIDYNVDQEMHSTNSGDDTTEDEGERLVKKQSIIEQKSKDEYYWIDSEWLKKWILGSNSPIDNSNLQCIHGHLNPNKLESMKRITKEAWTLLYDKMNGGPVFNQLSICNECLYCLCSQAKERTTGKNLKDHFISIEKKNLNVLPKRLKQKHNNQNSSNSNDNSNNQNEESQYYISKAWFNNWKKAGSNEFVEVSPTDNITCPHEGLNLDVKDRLQISKETWDHLFSFYPTSTILKVSETKQCILCTEKEDLINHKINSQVSLAKELKKEMKDLLQLINSKTVRKKNNISDGKYCVISKEWLIDWEDSVLNPDKVYEDEEDQDLDNFKINQDKETENKQSSTTTASSDILKKSTKSSSTKGSTAEKYNIKPIDNSDFICKEHNGFIYDLENPKIIKNLNQFSLQDNSNSYYDIQVPFILIPKSYYDKLASRYKVKNNLTIQVENGKLLEPISTCYECYLLQKENDQKNKLEFTDQSIYIHKLNDKDNENDKKYYEFPPSFRTPRSYRNEINPVNSNFTIEQLKLTICSFLDTSAYQQRLFILQQQEEDKEESKVVELKESDRILSEYKIVPNQIIVMKTLSDYSSFVDDSTYVETGFKGTIFNN